MTAGAEGSPLFSPKRGKLFIPYVMAGYPAAGSLPGLLRMLAQEGADAIEVGVPFSDPIADGPVIQAAGERALRNGMNLEKILGIVARLSPPLGAPLVLMSYLNPVQGFPIGGVGGFFKAARQVGIRGIILPDVPHEESRSLRGLAARSGLAWIGLVAPTSTPGRVAEIVRDSTGFVYAVSVAGVTGARARLPSELPAFLRRIKRRSETPVCLGFGVSTPRQAAAAARFCDGVIVGSALIEKLKEGTAPAARLARSIRRALN